MQQWKWLCIPDTSVGRFTKKRLRSSPTTPSSSYTSFSSGLLFGAHSLLFHLRWCQLFQLCEAQHNTSSVPCARHDPKVIYSCEQSSKRWTHTKAHTWMVQRQYLLLINGSRSCAFVPSSAQIYRHNVTNCCSVALMGVTAVWLLNCFETTSTRIEEQSRNATKYPHLKRYVRMLTASSNSSRLRWRLVLATGTGAIPARRTKRRVTTALRRLNWFRVSTSVGISSQLEELLTASLMPLKYQTNANVPNKAKTIWKIVTNLMHNSWEDSVRGWVLHRRMSHAQPQLHFRIHAENKQRHLQEERQAHRKNQTPNNSPMMTSSCLRARWEHFDGKHGWPLYYSHRKG